MGVRKHRVAALTILAVGVVGLLGWGRSMALESGEVRAAREKFRGRWVASSLLAGEHRKAEGAEAGRCSVVFDGKSVAFRGMVGGIDASGTFYIEDAHPGWVDFKLDEGWIVGLYAFEGESLKLCLNPFAPPERLGVPTLPRPKGFYSGDVRHIYVFRKAAGG
jgi:hypothetical protein